jgi:ubiquitin-protein ligase
MHASDGLIKRLQVTIHGGPQSQSGWLTLLVADCKNDKSSNIRIDLIDESPFHLKGSFPGPQDTPYEGGHFEVVSLISKLF